MFANGTIPWRPWVAALFLTCLPCSWASAQDLRDRFINEAPLAWREFSSLAREVGGTVTSKQIDRADAQRILYEGQTTIKQGNDRWAVHRSRPNSAVTADVMNPGFAFRVRRAGEGSAWALAAGDHNPNDGVGFSSRTPRQSADYWSSYALHFMTPNDFLPAMFESGRMVIDTVEYVRRVDEQDVADSLVRVTFDYTPEELANRPVHGGWVTLDPKHYWVIREFDCIAKWPKRSDRNVVGATGTIHGVYTYEIQPDGFPLIKSYRRRQLSDRSETGKNIDHEYLEDFQLTRGLFTDDEFELEAYGIETPAEVKQPLVLWPWACGIGIVLILLGYLALRYVRNRTGAR